MNKKKTIIIVALVIILIAILSVIILKNNFFLNTKFKYIVTHKAKNFATTNPVSTYSRYEIDLEKKTVELRETNIANYSRKLEYRKILTDEECNQLKKIFDKAINGIDKNYYQEQNSDKGFLNADMQDYMVDSKYKKNVKMCDEDESLFYDIVKK